MSRNECALLAVQRHGSTLTLRVDRDSLAQPDFVSPPVVVLRLRRCRDAAYAHEELQRAVGLQLDYEVSEVGAGVLVALYLDYHADPLEVACALAIESAAAYSPADWQTKCRRLARLYFTSVEEVEERAENVRRREALLEALGRELRKELDTCERKETFFSARQPAKAAIARAQARDYRRLLGLLRET